MAYKIKIEKKRYCDECGHSCYSYYHAKNICKVCLDRLRGGNKLNCIDDVHDKRKKPKKQRPLKIKSVLNERDYKFKCKKK